MQQQTQNNQNKIISKHFPVFEKILKNRFNWKNTLTKIAITLVVIASCLTIYDFATYFINGGDDELLEEIVAGISYNVINHIDENYSGLEHENNNETCNVSGIILHGELVTYISAENYDEEGYPISDQVASEDIVYYIEEAEKDDNIKAILIEIDSLGGWPVADEEVANALKKATKPTVALIRSAALSSAYYAATGADIIFASQDSDIGSIGVSYSYLDNAKKNQIEGITFNQISSGKYKDLMNPDKPLTSEERALLMRDVEIMNENFIRAVAENRNLEIDKVRQLADGSSMLGKMALNNGLIDRIGGLYEIKEYLKKLTGEEVKICW